MFEWIVIYSHIFTYKKYMYIKKSSTFANLLMEKRDIDLLHLIFL